MIVETKESILILAVVYICIVGYICLYHTKTLKTKERKKKFQKIYVFTTSYKDIGRPSGLFKYFWLNKCSKLKTHLGPIDNCENNVFNLIVSIFSFFYIM